MKIKTLTVKKTKGQAKKKVYDNQTNKWNCKHKHCFSEKYTKHTYL